MMINYCEYRAKAKDNNDYNYLKQAFSDHCKDGFVYGQLLVDDRQNRYYICVTIIAMTNCIIANGTVTVIEIIPESLELYKCSECCHNCIQYMA